MGVGPYWECHLNELQALLEAFKVKGFTLVDFCGNDFITAGRFPSIGKVTVLDRKGRVRLNWEAERSGGTTTLVLMSYSAPLIWFGSNHRLAKKILSLLPKKP